MVVRSLRHDCRTVAGRFLFARMVVSATRRRTLCGPLESGGVPGGSRRTLDCALLATRCVERIHADRSHAAAHAPDDGRATADPSWPTAHPDRAWSAEHHGPQSSWGCFALGSG